MLTQLPQPHSTVQGTLGTMYLLVLDARGNPLALAPLRQLPDNPFAPEQIRLVDGQAKLLEQSLPVAPPEQPDSGFQRQVESAIKHLHDLAFLCDHPLTQTGIVSRRLVPADTQGTCLDRARLLSELLRDAVEQLRPNGPMPARTAVPRREWHPYLVMHLAYVQGEDNYSIMNWLQIGEGTFNRTRRRALAAVARVLTELS